MTILNVLFFLLAYILGVITMAILSASSRERAVEEAYRMGMMVRDFEKNTIDVTELVKEDKQK